MQRLLFGEGAEGWISQQSNQIKQTMSLEKAIKHGKEKRAQYHGIKRWDAACRNHGTCKHCLSNRTHAARRRALAWADQLAA